eukprot:g7733.t1
MPQKSSNPVVSLTSGCIAGAVEAICVWPLEYDKLPAGQKPKYTGVVSGLTYTVRTTGFFSLYRGLAPTLLGSMPKAGIRFGGNSELKKLFAGKDNKKLNSGEQFLAGFGAGVLEAIFAVTPIETVKTKAIQTNAPFMQGVKTILKTEGPAGLYQGVWATIAKQGSNQGLRFMWFNKYKGFMSNDGARPLTDLENLFGGMSAGCFSTLGNNPFDVVKTRMQGVDAAKYKNTADCFRQIIAGEGVKGLYKGVVPRLGRVIPGQGIIFMSYERIQTFVARIVEGPKRKGTSSAAGRKSRLAPSNVGPPPERAATQSTGADLTKPRPRRARSSPSDHSNSRVRSPLARYLLLSGIMVVAGLCFRYLWRQLAGLVGAALILSTARRWSSGTSTRSTRGVSSSAAVRSGRVKESSPSAQRNTSAHSGDDGSDPAVALTGQRPVGPGGSDGGGGFTDAPAALSRFWEDGGPGCKLLVRGPKYVVDRKKIPSGPAAMRLVHVDLFSVEKEVFHVASKGRCRDRVSGFLRSYENRGEIAPFLFILNILVPGNPVVATVMYWTLDGVGDGEESSTGAGSSYGTFLKMLERYAEVPGSGYKKLERVRSSAPSSPPPPSTSPTEVNVSSSPSSSSSSSSGSPSPPEARQPGASPPASAPLPQVMEGGNGTMSATNRGVNGESGSSSSSSGSSSSRNVDEGVSAEEPSLPGGVGAGAGAGTSAPNRRGLEQRGQRLSGSQLAGRKSDRAGLLPEDDFRNQRFKLIPSIVSGPFIVRKAVGNKPALLGRKVSQRYFRGPGYVETDIDVGSSIIAEKIVSLCRGCARSLTVELGICLEGRCEEELPEKLIGAIRLISLDLDQAEPLLEPGETPTQ